MAARKFTAILMVIGMVLVMTNILTRTASADLNNGLVAYYPFNGNANDESGNGNHGMVHGATLAEDRFGNPNTAYYFDGEDDYIDANSSDVLNITDAITISAWANPSSTNSSWPTIVMKWSGSAHYESYGLFIQDYYISGEITTNNGNFLKETTDSVIILNEIDLLKKDNNLLQEENNRLKAELAEKDELIAKIKDSQASNK